MLTFRCDDKRGVDGIILEIAVCPVSSWHTIVQFFVRVVRDDKAFILPTVDITRIRGLHQSDKGTLTPCAVTVNRTRNHDTVIHTVQPCLHLTDTGSPVTIIRTCRRSSKTHFCTYLIQLRLYPRGGIWHGGTQILPVYQVSRTAAMEMTMSCLWVTVAGICTIHIIIAIVSLHYRRIMHIAKIPLTTLIPCGDTTIVVNIRRSFPVIQVGTGFLRRRERHIIRILYSGTRLCIGTDMISRRCLQGGKCQCHLCRRTSHLGIVDCRIGVSAIAHTTARDS